MRRTVLITSAVLAALGLTAAAGRAQSVEAFHLVEQSVVVDANAGTATFRLSFDREPQFFVPAGGTEQTNAFQVEVDGDKFTFEQPIGFDEIDSVVRGAEIFGGSEIPLRDPQGDGGPQAGGWGPVRDTLAFEVDGATLTFSAPLETLGDADGDGRFRYRIITIDEGGELTGETNAAIIPLPGAFWTGAMLLSGAGVVCKAGKRLFR